MSPKEKQGSELNKKTNTIKVQFIIYLNFNLSCRAREFYDIFCACRVCRKSRQEVQYAGQSQQEVEYAGQSQQEVEYAGQSQQEAKTGGPVYTLCYMFMERVFCVYLVKTEFFFSFQNNFKHEDHLVRLI